MNQLATVIRMSPKSTWPHHTKFKNNYKVIFEDERLTTVLAKKEIIKQKISTGRNKSLIDQVSAAFILQSYLDRKKIFSR